MIRTIGRRASWGRRSSGPRAPPRPTLPASTRRSCRGRWPWGRARAPARSSSTSTATSPAGPARRRRRYDLKSTTKSFGGLLLCLGLDDHKVTLARRAPTRPELRPAERGARPRKVTVGQLATHTAGFDKPGGFVPILYKPGSAFAYSDGGANWLADVLTSAYHRDLAALFRDRIGSKLGITIGWRGNAYRPATLGGVPRREFGSGVSASVGAMARVGQLLLQGGRWDGSPVLSPGCVRSLGIPRRACRACPSGPRSRPVRAGTTGCCGGTTTTARCRACRGTRSGAGAWATASSWWCRARGWWSRVPAGPGSGAGRRTTGCWRRSSGRWSPRSSSGGGGRPAQQPPGMEYRRHSNRSPSGQQQPCRGTAARTARSRPGSTR